MDDVVGSRMCLVEGEAGFLVLVLCHDQYEKGCVVFAVIVVWREAVVGLGTVAGMNPRFAACSRSNSSIFVYTVLLLFSLSCPSALASLFPCTISVGLRPSLHTGGIVNETQRIKSTNRRKGANYITNSVIASSLFSAVQL
jgi:hypothetical protein